jgi:hypothetical protein
MGEYHWDYLLGGSAMEAVGISLAVALGLCGFMGGTALLMWIDARNKRHERELKHAERLKALEMGQPLPDLENARVRTEQVRTILLGMVAFMVPPGLAGTAVGATALVLYQASPSIHLPLLCVIWGVIGVVSLVAISTTVPILGGVKRTHSAEDEKEVATADRMAERIKEPATRL